MARPTKYKKSLGKELIEYFDVPPTYTEQEEHWYQGQPYYQTVTRVSELPTIERWGAEKGLAVSTLWEWRKLYPEFSKAYETALQLQEAMIVQNAIVGRFVGPFATFYLTNRFKYSNRQELTGADGAPLMPIALDETILNRHTSDGTPSQPEEDSEE